jgi:two-component system sensor histidine kinase GlrK
LKQVEEMKADFFATMSHELRTPLTSIHEGAQLLLESPDAIPPDARQRLLVIMAEQSNRLIDMVTALLDLSKMEAGMMRYHFRTADICQIISVVIKEHEPLAAARGITLKHEGFSGHCPLKADDERIRQVMRNLIANALRFTPRGGSIAILAHRENSELLVSVSDSGAGIPAEELQTIFHKYRQSSQPKDRRNGTGLGLAIVQNIIVAHGGRIWAESTPGAGSTFIFALPL